MISASCLMISCSDDAQTRTADVITATEKETAAETTENEKIDFSYKSKYAKINYPEVPYYGYTDPLETLFYSKQKYSKIAEKYNEDMIESSDEVSYRNFKDGVELPFLYADDSYDSNTELPKAASANEKGVAVIPEKIDGKPVLKLGGYLAAISDQEALGGDVDSPEYSDYNFYEGYSIACGGEDDRLDIKKVIIPSTLKEIVFCSFEHMEELEEIEVSKDNPYYSSENGILYNKDKTILLCIPQKNRADIYNVPKSVKKMYSLFSGRASVVNIPSNVESIKNVVKSEEHSEISNVRNSTYDLDMGCNYDIKLKAINVDKNNKKYSSLDGVLYNKKKTVLYAYPRNKRDKSFKVPDSVVKIEPIYLSFTDKLNEIVFNKNIKKIGFCAEDTTEVLEELTIKGYKNTPVKKWYEENVGDGKYISLD